MRNKIITILILSNISIVASFSQTINVGMTKHEVDSILNYPKNVDTLFRQTVEEAYIYEHDFGVFFYNGKVLEFKYNYSISTWETHMSTVLACGKITSEKDKGDPIQLKIYSDLKYFSGDEIIINCDIINISSSKYKFYNNDSNYYNKRDCDPAFFLAVVSDKNGNRICKGLNDCSTIMKQNNVSKNDYLKLKPKERVTKQLNISKLVYGCNCANKNGLIEGYYKIQVKYDWYWSNVLIIHVENNN